MSELNSWTVDAATIGKCCGGRANYKPKQFSLLGSADITSASYVSRVACDLEKHGGISMFIRSTNWLLRDAVKKCGVPALAISGGLLLAPYASSQTTSSTASTSDQKVEEVIVSGVREAIKTSQEIKKEADT